MVRERIFSSVHCLSALLGGMFFNQLSVGKWEPIGVDGFTPPAHCINDSPQPMAIRWEDL